MIGFSPHDWKLDPDLYISGGYDGSAGEPQLHRRHLPPALHPLHHRHGNSQEGKGLRQSKK